MDIYKQIIRMANHKEGHADFINTSSIDHELDKEILFKIANIENETIINKLNKILKIASMIEIPDIDIPEIVVNSIVKL